MGRAELKVEGGKMIKIQLTRKKDKIEEIRITGDFFLHPEDLIEELERMLMGCLLDERILTESIKNFIDKKSAILLGASPEDFAKCILMAGEKDG